MSVLLEYLTALLCFQSWISFSLYRQMIIPELEDTSPGIKDTLNLEDLMTSIPGTKQQVVSPNVSKVILSEAERLGRYHYCMMLLSAVSC